MSGRRRLRALALRLVASPLLAAGLTLVLAGAAAACGGGPNFPIAR